VENNAAWCDVICRTHGLKALVEDDAWTSPTRTPPLYPDAVTLSPIVSIPGLLERIDSGPGCSVKDSFASVDLSDSGFRVLLDAQWMARDAPASSTRDTSDRWDVVREPTVFAAWERAWRGDDGPDGVLRPALLDRPDVAVLAKWTDARITAGAVLNQSAGVVGVTNVFADGSMDAEFWTGVVALATRLFPGSSLVGYETGDRLRAARLGGWQMLGKLRVWIKDDQP
jgi:hypothetical protein